MKKILGVILSASMLLPVLALAQTGQVTPTHVKANTYSGTASDVSSTGLTLTASDSTVYTVDTSAVKKVVRKFYGSTSPGAIQNGDSLQVRGTLTGTDLAATYIMDSSQQARNGSFSGSVTAVNGSSFTLQSKNRADQTVNTTSSTVFDKNGQADSNGIGDVAVGSNLTVSGVWDSTNNVIAAAKVNLIVRTKIFKGVFVSYSGTAITMNASNSSSTVYSVDASSAKLVRRYGAAMQFTD